MLEARPRTGGRIDTHYHSDSAVPLELGAEFVHKPAPLIISLLKKAGIAAVETSETSLTRSERGLEPSGLQWELFDKVFTRAAEAGPEVSFSDFLASHCRDLSRQEKSAITAFVEGFNAARSAEISARELGIEHISNEDQATDSLRIEGGCGLLVKALQSSLERPGCALHLSAEAEQIRWEADGASVSAAGGALEVFSTKVICTLPPPLLMQGSKLRFVPEIPAKRQAAGEIGFGTAIKLLLSFKSPWWASARGADGKPIQNISFVTDQSQAVPVWWTSAPLPSNLLVGWIGGTKAEALAKCTDQEMTELGITSLASIFGLKKETIRAELEFAQLSGWHRDPFSGGAYSYPRAGFPDAQGELARPIDGVLFFAGEATHKGGVGGTMESAVASGIRAAEEILQVL